MSIATILIQNDCRIKEDDNLKSLFSVYRNRIQRVGHSMAPF